MTKKEHIRLNIYLSTNIKTALYYEQSKLGVMEIRGNPSLNYQYSYFTVFYHVCTKSKICFIVPCVSHFAA